MPLTCRYRRYRHFHRLSRMNVSEFVWKRLSDWGVQQVYGCHGEGVGGSLGLALENNYDTMEMEDVQVRHEAMALAFAHAKVTGQDGLCYATSGPGAIHSLIGLYDAKMDHVRGVAVGQEARCGLGAGYKQEELNNHDFNQVAWEERIRLGAGRTESTQSIPDFPYHKYAELIGLKGVLVDDPDQVGPARTKRCQRTDRSSSKPIPIPTCRYCRRTSRSNMPRSLSAQFHPSLSLAAC